LKDRSWLEASNATRGTFGPYFFGACKNLFVGCQISDSLLVSDRGIVANS
jgi:hypothetical protein